MNDLSRVSDTIAAAPVTVERERITMNNGLHFSRSSYERLFGGLPGYLEAYGK